MSDGAPISAKLVRTENHILIGMALVDRQRKLVKQVQHRSEAYRQARILLANLERSLSIQLAVRDRLAAPSLLWRGPLNALWNVESENSQQLLGAWENDFSGVDD